jgi:hypothetical protein
MSAATITNAFNDSIKRVTVQPISNGLVITGIR